MSHIIFLLYLLTNFYSSAICDTKCKEYIIIVKETTCPTNLSLIREPIKLDDVILNYDNFSKDSLKLLSNYENSKKSYVIKFDYVGLESICVPMIKSNKLLEHIKIDDESITTYENKKFGKDRHEISKTIVIEDNDTKTYPLECLVKNYKQTCKKKESKETLKNEIVKTVDINLTHATKSTSNITEFIYNNTMASIIFEKCVLDYYHCTNSNIIDSYSGSNKNISQIIFTSIENNDSLVSSIMNINTNNLNCTNIIKNHKHINISHIKVLTNSIITKYYCQDEEIDNRNLTLPIYDVNVYISVDLNVLNTKLKYVNCTGSFKSKNNTRLSLDCNLNEPVEMSTIKDSYTTPSGNNSLPDIDSFEEDFNKSLVYHCKIKEANKTRQSYSETAEIFNTYKVFDYQTCTVEYSTDDKKALLDGSKVIIFSEEVDKDDFKNLEDFGSHANSESLKLHFIHNNISDCNERIPLNISKGRIISLWPDEEQELTHNYFNSTLLTLVITNCDTYNNKSMEYKKDLDLDIILINTNNHSNETKVNKLKNTLWNNSNRAILNCGYFNENTQLYNINSLMECIFLESNDNMTTTGETPSSKSATENKNVHLGNHHNDSHNVHDKGINTTTKLSKENYFSNEQESKDEGKVRNDNKSVKKNITTETDIAREKAAIQRNHTEYNDPLQEMYYVSPRVITTAVVSLLAVIGSVVLYALYLFKKKQHEYQMASTRDWSEMDATQF